MAMRAQCVLVATTLLHSGVKFHFFLYTGSKTLRVNMESCYGGMSTRLKQRAVTEFLSAENVKPAEIHRRLQAVYGENTVNRTTVNFVNVNQVVPILLPSAGKILLTVFWYSQRVYMTEFLEAGITVNSARYT